jgi:hypothetical protein
MVDWKIYIDSVQKRALALCEGSLDEGDGFGIGLSYGPARCAGGWGDGAGLDAVRRRCLEGGDGQGGGTNTHFNGNGFSTQVW